MRYHLQHLGHYHFHLKMTCFEQQLVRFKLHLIFGELLQELLSSQQHHLLLFLSVHTPAPVVIKMLTLDLIHSSVIHVHVVQLLPFFLNLQ